MDLRHGEAVQPARLVGLANAVPPHVLRQDEVAAEAVRLFGGRHSDLERLLPVFVNSGIETRYSVRPMGWFGAPRDWPQRTEAYLDGASALFVEVAQAALADAGVAASDVDAIVTISSTGIATPSLEALAHRRLGLRADVRRVPVFGLGCAGGATGLAIAARMAQAAPGETILLVTVELCTLSFRDDELTKANIVATALFGDGAAAAVLRAGGEEGPAINASGEHLWPETLDVMGWRIDPVGFSAIFSRSIPDIVTERLRPAAEDFLAGHGRRLGDIDHFVFHPGGARVVEALEQAFSLESGNLVAERDVLRRFGNMSAPTVLFVLRQMLDEGMSGEGLIGALGPGFTASFVTFTA